MAVPYVTTRMHLRLMEVMCVQILKGLKTKTYSDVLVTSTYWYLISRIWRDSISRSLISKKILYEPEKEKRVFKNQL